MATSSDAPSASRRPSKPHICLDAGHGGVDPGAVFRSYREKDITLAIVHELATALKRNSCDVTFTRSEDTTISLGQRVKTCNDAKCDVFVSIHLNADADPDSPGMPEASGAEVWHHPLSKDGAALSEAVAYSLRQSLFGHGFRGVKTSKNLYVLKHTRCPAVLIECGFIDSRHDAAVLNRPANQVYVAALIARGIAEFLQSRTPPA